MYGNWAQKFVICLYIGPVAQSEDKGLSEKEISLSEEATLVNREISLSHNSSRGGPRISTSSANQCRGLKRLPVVPGNIPESSMGADMYYSDIRQGEILKISWEKAAASALNTLQLTLWPH